MYLGVTLLHFSVIRIDNCWLTNHMKLTDWAIRLKKSCWSRSHNIFVYINNELTTCFHEFSVTKYLQIFQETEFVYSDALLM